jgi:hypothetical protein
MFKFKKRSARGINSMQSYLPSTPGKGSTSAKMGSADENPAHADDSVIPAIADTGAFHEPLVMDFDSIYDGHTRVQSPPLTPPPSHKASQEQQNTWLSYEDEDKTVTLAPAPAVPDYTPRGIHIPSRTR